MLCICVQTGFQMSLLRVHTLLTGTGTLLYDNQLSEDWGRQRATDVVAQVSLQSTLTLQKRHKPTSTSLADENCKSKERPTLTLPVHCPDGRLTEITHSLPERAHLLYHPCSSGSNACLGRCLAGPLRRHKPA